jgi:MFS family permease
MTTETTAAPASATPAGTGLGANYWKLWASSAASNLADGVFWIAFPLLAIRLTDSPVLIAGVAVVSRLPWLIFVLIAGALADRLDRRRTMIGVSILRTIVALVIALTIVTSTDSLWLLYVTAFVLGVGETLFDTAAQSVMPSIVRRDDLSKANGRLYAVELTMNQFVGPPLGGFLAGVAIAFAFAGSALAFAFAAIALSLLTGSFKPVRAETAGPRPSVAADIKEGLGYLWNHRLLRTLAIMVGTMNLASAATFSVFVLYAVSPGPMGLDEFGFGLLMTGMAIGSLFGSLVVERVERVMGRARLLTTAVIINAITVAIPGLTPNPWIVGASFAVAGVGIVMWNVVTVSLRQRIVPDALLGRLNASYRLLAWGSQPIGALLGGLLATWLGLPAVFIIAGVVVGLLLFLRRIITNEAIEAAEAEGDAEAARLAAATEAPMDGAPDAISTPA